MRTFIQNILVAAMLILLVGCSDDPPSVRVSNQHTAKANVQFKQANGNTINQNDIAGGQATNYQDVAEGRIEVTAGIQGETVAPTTTFTTSNNTNYTIVIVASTPPALRVDSSEK